MNELCGFFLFRLHAIPNFCRQKNILQVYVKELWQLIINVSESKPSRQVIECFCVCVYSSGMKHCDSFEETMKVAMKDCWIKLNVANYQNTETHAESI